MSVDKKEVEYIAELAMLSLSDEEKTLYTGQLTSILGWIEQLKELNTDNICPTSTTAERTLKIRADIPSKFTNTEKILANAPMREYDFVKVKKVIAND